MELKNWKIRIFAHRVIAAKIIEKIDSGSMPLNYTKYWRKTVMSLH